MVKQMLKKLRKEHHLTQEDVAKILGIDRTTYTFYETGKTSPSIATLVTLANMYNCSLGYIAGVEDNNPRFKRIQTDFSISDPDPVARLSKEEQLAVLYFRLVPDDKIDEVVDVIRSYGRK